MRRIIPGTIVLACVVLMLTIMRQGLQAQTFTVLHNFTGGADGGYPYAGVTMDRAGNLYGTTYYGTVYKMTHTGVSWTLATLGDVGETWAGVTIGPNGSLYGTTYDGGAYGNGSVFNLRPPLHACSNVLCSWTETVLYSFQGGTDGANPASGVIFDQAGNIYGTTAYGGLECYYLGNCGTVYEVTPSGSGWTESVIYAFSGSDGESPLSSVIFDNAGNLYGTTWGGGTYPCGGSGCGTVFELTPTGSGGWAESFLYSFTNGADGLNPYAGLIFDPSGNLYGATAGGSETAFKLTPSGVTWTFSLVYSFTGGDWCGPRATLVMDGAGNLYGTTACDVPNGTVFKLTPSDDGTWTYTLLHGFTDPDGALPFGGVVIDANGNLYGTTSAGGQYGYGVVWEITP
ncbi:MAG: choice-of-anchor tandem repeat GloVer-containing protein [Candidatus Korobacteraceae bacterium]|jgi:uncharacterized repeat protein (TIGR03803 family)